MGLNYNPRIVLNGLVLCLDAGNTKSYPGSGTDWIDMISGYNCTMRNGAAYSAGSMVFDGSNDDCYNTTLPSNIFNTDFSQSAWFYKTNATQIWQGIFSNCIATTTFAYAMTFGNGSVQAPYNSLGTNRVGSVPDGIFLDLGTHTGRWLNATITRSGGTLTIYCFKDGALLKNSGAPGYTFTSVAGYLIGKHWGGGSIVPFAGNIANVCVWNRALTEEEVYQNYQALRGRFGV